MARKKPLYSFLNMNYEMVKIDYHTYYVYSLMTNWQFIMYGAIHMLISRQDRAIRDL